MRKRMLALTAALCLLLCGCTSWMDGSYSSVNPHTQRQQQPADQTVTAANYQQLRDALVDLVESGTESMLINVAQMEQDSVQSNMDRAVQYTTQVNAIGAYAVENIDYEQGTSGGQPALAVTVTYNHNRAEILRIMQAQGMEEAEEIITSALNEFESSVVMRVSNFRSRDFDQMVRDYADERPDLVMELPQLTVSTYPESGYDRVVEIVFTYQSNRDALRTMQSRVRPLFTAAELYVAGSESDMERYSQLYVFLMERNEYEIGTSITPSYSLLVHGVGDSRAFAVVFASMCSRADLECMVVSGTCNGEPLFWNIICVDGVYYHVDLIHCNSIGAFQLWGDADMSGYVWDYSAYPECGPEEPETQPTEPTVDPTIE